MNNSFIGQTLNNRYRLDALLGDGGMGTVYRSFDNNLQRQVAIKLMHGHYARQAEFRQRLIQEAQTAARLDHTSIVRIYDFGESDLGLFIAMEYVGGGSLRDHLQRLQRLNKFLPFNQSLQIGIQMAEALDYAHRQGVIHRDVKPGNIMLKRLNEPDIPGDQPFRALLTDFGLVKLQEGGSMTQSGATVGTPTYMSPEQCEGRSLDGRSDVYSLGIVLYELVSNRLPFAFQSLADAISTHRQGIQPSPPSEYRADAPALIDNLLAQALAKSPDQRFATAREMAQALRGALVSLEGAPTRVLQRQELSILARVDSPPSGYDLLVKAPGHEARPVPLAHAVVTIGRNADNDIVLPADGVSRHHARLQATSLGWEVVDLGGVNGTWIDNRRLRPNELTGVATGSVLRIGPYELTLDGPELPVEALAATAVAATLPGTTTPGLVSPTMITGPLGLFLTQDNYAVEPGQQVELRIEVVNNSTIDDRVMLRVQGVPEAWIVTPSRFVAVAAGETATLVTVIRPPRRRSTPTGRQRVRFQLVSQRHPNANVAVTANLNLGTFEAFGAALEPQQLRIPGTATVSVKSTGNAPTQFSVTARDPNNALKFFGEKGRILLQPNEVAQVPLEIELREQDLVGSSEIYPYEVLVVSRKGGRQTLQGEAQSGGRLPPWLLYLLIFLVTLACALLAIAALVSISRGFFPGATDTPTPINEFAVTETAVALTRNAGAVNDATSTSIAATQTAVSGSDLTATAITQNVLTATAIAATAVVEGDNDLDGLSNGQEASIGTDPNNPDTDGDGLSDGQEVLVLGTNPLNKDTDGDQLDDGQEVLVHKTNPRNPDTDGDSFSDGQEVLVLKSNPLDPNDPQSKTPTATRTISAPEMTATAVSMTATAISANATATSVAATATANASGNSATATSESLTATAAAGANTPPSVNAGPNDTITLPNVANLNGTVTDDGLPNPPGAYTTLWTHESGPGVVTFADATAEDTTANFTDVGVHVLRLTADDGALNAFAEVTITVDAVANTPPSVNAGPNDTITLPSVANLNGTVTDDGLPNPPGAYTTLWTHESGPGVVTFADATAEDTTANFTDVGVHVLRLTADDGALNAFAEVTITVDAVANTPPSVNAGPNDTITLPSVANLNGTVTDDGLPNPPGAYTTLWTHESGPGVVTFADATAEDTTANFTDVGVHVLRLTADDGALNAFAEVTITVDAVANTPPSVNAGPNDTITLPSVANLNGTVTDDGLPNPPGAYTTLWTHESGPGVVTFADATAEDTTANFTDAGVHVLRLTADDGALNAFAEVTITVNP